MVAVAWPVYEPGKHLAVAETTKLGSPLLERVFDPRKMKFQSNRTVMLMLETGAEQVTVPVTLALPVSGG
jgi:hypothetical protein